MRFRQLALSAVAAAMAVLGSGGAGAAILGAGGSNPLTFSWSFDTNTAAGTLTGSGSILASGFNSSSLSLQITLNNTSLIANDRLVSFGFGIEPNATTISFVDAADGGMINAVPNTGGNTNIPSLTGIEVCAFGGSNCAGGGNGGIASGGGSDTFTITLGGTWGDAVTIEPIGFKYQTGSGSFEFTTSSSTSTSTSSGASGSAPEPLSTGLVGLGVALVGLTSIKRRRPVQAAA